MSLDLEPVETVSGEAGGAAHPPMYWPTRLMASPG